MDSNRLPIVLVTICVLLGGGLFLWLEFGPKPAVKESPLTDEARAYIHNLALDDVTMNAKLNYFSQKAVEIEGKIGNKGDRGLKVVEVTCVFRDTSGQVLLRERVPIVSRRMGGLNRAKPSRSACPSTTSPTAGTSRCRNW